MVLERLFSEKTLKKINDHAYTFFKSEENRKKYKELMFKILELSEKAHREGILALEEGLDDFRNSFLGSCICLILDGTSAEHIISFADSLIINDKSPDIQFLRNACLDGVLDLQSGENLNVTAEDFYSKIPDEFKDYKDHLADLLKNEPYFTKHLND